MKTFQEFLSEDAAADTQSTISRGVVGGGSKTFGDGVNTSFKKRPKTGLGAYLKDKFKNRDNQVDKIFETSFVNKLNIIFKESLEELKYN